MTAGATESDLLSRAELSALLGVNESTLSGWAAKSLLVPFPAPASQRGHQLLYRRDEVLEWFGGQAAALEARGHQWWAGRFRNYHAQLSVHTGTDLPTGG